jgi:hypothetical protein
MWTVRGVKFQELSFNSFRDAAEKVVCFRSKVALITYRSQRSLHRLQRVRGQCDVRNYRKIPTMEAEM